MRAAEQRTAAPSGLVKILDFGIAALAEQWSRDDTKTVNVLTGQGVTLGTLPTWHQSRFAVKPLRPRPAPGGTTCGNTKYSGVSRD